MEACLFTGSFSTEKKSSLCLWAPIKTCTDRRYRRGSSVVTPFSSIVKQPPRASQKRQTVVARDVCTRTDDRHTHRLKGVCADQRPPWECLILSPPETFDCGSRVKNKTICCLCTTEQLHCSKTADAGTFHLPKNSPKSEGSRDIREVKYSRAKGESSRTF